MGKSMRATTAFAWVVVCLAGVVALPFVEDTAVLEAVEVRETRSQVSLEQQAQAMAQAAAFRQAATEAEAKANEMAHQLGETARGVPVTKSEAKKEKVKADAGKALVRKAEHLRQAARKELLKKGKTVPPELKKGGMKSAENNIQKAENKAAADAKQAHTTTSTAKTGTHKPKNAVPPHGANTLHMDNVPWHMNHVEANTNKAEKVKTSKHKADKAKKSMHKQ